MHNILHAPLSTSDLTALFAAGPRHPLLPRMDDPAWAAALAKPAVRRWIEQIRPVALAEADTPMPVLTPELYGIYHRTGSRWELERPYFERRRRIGRAAILALLDPFARPVALASLTRKFQELLEEPAWCFPAHAGVPSGINPDQVDLFAAETANLVGILLTLFPNAFPTDLTAAARARVHTQTFETYLNKDYFWTAASHNWNAVCHQGVIGAALALVDDPACLACLVEKMSRHLPQFLSGFTADGGSSEGPGYWTYGFGWFAELNRQLEARTGHRLSLFHDDPLVAAICRFGPALTLSGDLLVNFSDASWEGPLSPSLLAYLATRTGDPVLATHALRSYHHVADRGVAVDGQRSDLQNLEQLILNCPQTIPATAPELPATDTYLPHLAVLVARDRDTRGHLWELAAKAGHNAEHHNHNDIGSFLLNVDARRVVIEIGAPEYVKDFFRAETRYTFFAARSLGHSVPLINGVEQSVGETFSGRILSHTSTADATSLEIDFTAAYPAAGGLSRGVRTLTLDKRAGTFTLRDAFTLTRTDAVESALMLPTQPTLAPDGTATFTVDTLTFRLTPDAATRFAPPQTHTYKPHGVSAPIALYRLPLRPAAEPFASNPVLSCTVSFA